ncbi:stage II sporulation protein E [Thermicanus aegyptius]|uniref:stage II sporulation protein E n=1 Tax=Thermicanus aegyptius TaxID=94009 RepID=UPI000419EE9C|nr:stage II sporulation protein E [Thermicanus aegyptius]
MYRKVLLWFHPIKELAIRLLLHPFFILFFLGFLLGRAVILSEIAPFPLAYYAIVYHMQRERANFAFLGVVAGSLFSISPHLLETIIPILLFLGLQQILRRLNKEDITYAPFFVLFSSLIGGGMIRLPHQPLDGHVWLLLGVEALLAMVLTFIFHQAFPILLHRQLSTPMKQEELISLLILFASIMTGTVGWFIEEYSLEHIFSRYLILLLSLAGGGTIGATVGVLTGLILSLAHVQALAQMSLLGFSGLLAGLFREGKKAGVSLGLLLGTSILIVYTGEREAMWSSSVETIVSILLFLITPKALIEEMAKWLPGTKEYVKEQQERLGRFRELTSERVMQFADLFRQLSKSFAQTSAVAPENLEEVKIDYFLSAVTDQTCQRCWKKEQCWTRQFDFTYEHLKGMVSLVKEDQLIHKVKLPMKWRNTCVRIDQMIQVMEGEYEKRLREERLNRRIKEARLLVADQLQGVASVMRDFAFEVKREGKDHSFQEKRIVQALESLGLKIQKVDVISLEKGNVEIEILHPTCGGRRECEKLIAPLLTDVLKEHIVVKEGGCSVWEGGCLMRLVSGKKYRVEVGMAQAAKDGGILSGDSYISLDLGNGNYAIALSDGMGNGQRAFTESSATVDLLKRILQSGLDEGLAVKTVNSILSLRSTDEVFATVDLALIDLRDASAKFLKIGSAPSFIKRGEKVKLISANNLPVGILEEIEVDVVRDTLMPGDLLIMITDGIYEANRNVENRDQWFKRMIRDMETENPQEVADLLLENMIRVMNYEISDDMTVVVARVDHFRPKWSTIPIPDLLKMERGSFVQ